MARVKHVAGLSPTQLEALLVETSEVRRRKHKIGLVVLKRSGGRGWETPLLVCMMEEMWDRALLACD